MSNAIYYFTGTGNSLAVAKDIAQQLGDTVLLKIHNRQMDTDAAQYERVGFVFPVYYYKMPVFMESFIKKIKLRKDQYIFGVATHGGTRGLSLKGLRDLLSAMGYSLKGEFSVWMPGNHIAEYGALPAKFNNYLIKRSKKITVKISMRIKSKDKTPSAGPRSFERIYLRSEKNREFIDAKRLSFASEDTGFTCNDSCNGCGICSGVCPVQNIVIEKDKPNWNHQCERCMACIQWCPQNSIHHEDKTLKRKRYTHSDIALKEIMRDKIDLYIDK